MSTAASKEFRHDLPDDLRTVLSARPDLDAKWQGLTDLGRNEWICWMTSPKTEATRAKRLERLQGEVGDGKRRPAAGPVARTASTPPANGSTPDVCGVANPAALH